MPELSRTEVVEWVAQVYGAANAEQRVVEGPAAFVHTAKSDRRLLRALRKVVADVHWPMGTVNDGSLGSAEDKLAEWLRVTRGWRTIDGRIRELGWAFAVSPQPDAFHDGNQLAVSWRRTCSRPNGSRSEQDASW